MKITKTLLLLTLLAAFALVGCSGTDAPTATQDVAVDDYDAMDVNKAYGGLTFTDENEDFDDADLTALAAAADAAESDDPLQDDLEVAELEALLLEDDPADPRPRPVITVVKLTWGQLDGLVEDIEDGFDVLDWSGLVSVDRGVVVARRLILFERPRDHLVHPRIDRRTVAWVSHTGPHYDGVILEIVEPPVDEAEVKSDEPNMFHFSTPQISFDLTVAELAGMNETRPVDDQGNAVQLEGFHLSDLDLCPKGFLSGVWVADPLTDEEGDVVADGFFKGRWIGLWGHLKGLVRGRYGVTDEGEPVFYGKYVTRNGRFQGLIEGTYDPLDENGHGAFSGRWINAAGSVEGVLGGDVLQLPERPGGFFSGRWATLCDEDVETIE